MIQDFLKGLRNDYAKEFSAATPERKKELIILQREIQRILKELEEG
jgi:hypothetical protein